MTTRRTLIESIRAMLDSETYYEEDRMKLHAKTVEDCWDIARREAKAYQRQMNQATTTWERHLCQASRDAADRIALKIRHGRGNKRKLTS